MNWNAGAHVEVGRSGADRGVQQMEMSGTTGVVSDADGETQADEEVGGCQVLEEDTTITGWKQTSTEVEPQ